MIRTSIALVALGIATLVTAEVTSRPPDPMLDLADLTGAWAVDSPDNCGATETQSLQFGADGSVTMDLGFFAVSGTLVDLDAIWIGRFQSRQTPTATVRDDQGNNWLFVFELNNSGNIIQGTWTEYQSPEGNVMVMPRLGRFHICAD